MDHKSRLVRFYEKYNPEKVDQVDKALVSYAGKEEAMWTALISKYGPEPPLANHRDRLMRFYQKYNPEKVGQVDAALAQFTGKEDAMWSKLIDKYGPEPEEFDHRERLIRFYKKYNPEKVDQVDKALTTFAGREADMWKSLVEKYGPEPRDDGEPNLASGNQFRDRLVAFYTKYNPDKLGQVDAALQKFHGQEETMFVALVEKYGPEPGAEVAVNWKARIERIYQQYAPEKVGQVATALEKYSGREEALLEALITKYGPEPQGSVPEKAATLTRSPSREASQQSSRSLDPTRMRLEAFFQTYAPDKIVSVDAMLQKYKGQEDALFTALVAKYGPEPSRSGSADVYKERLMAFYAKYAPERVGTVDAALVKYQGQEEALFEALVKKYGPEPRTERSPSVPATPQSGLSTATDSRVRLIAFYTKYAQDRLSTIDATLTKYRGQEDALFQALVAKYGPEPTPISRSSSISSFAGVGYKTRLTAFYAKYAPDRAATVDSVLSKYKGQEEALFQALVGKYGPEPSVISRGGSSADLSSMTFKERLTCFYTKYAPERLATVDTAIVKYKGQEEALFQALVSKYGPEPQPSRSGSDCSRTYRDRLVAFYSKHAPEKISTVDAALAKYNGQEEALFQALVNKYGPEPQEASQSHVLSRSTSAAASQPDPYTDRLTRFFEKYAPEKVHTVQAALAKYKGQETALFEALVKKYGPEPEHDHTSAVQQEDTDSMSVKNPKKTKNPRRVPNSNLLVDQRVRALLEAHCPERVGQVDTMLQKYAGQEEALVAALVAKYGPEPHHDLRLRRFLEVRAPERLDAATTMLQKYQGRESELFTALVAKHGDEPAYEGESSESEQKKEDVSEPASVTECTFQAPSARPDGPAAAEEPTEEAAPDSPTAIPHEVTIRGRRLTDDERQRLESSLKSAGLTWQELSTRSGDKVVDALLESLSQQVPSTYGMSASSSAPTVVGRSAASPTTSVELAAFSPRDLISCSSASGDVGPKFEDAMAALITAQEDARLKLVVIDDDVRALAKRDMRLGAKTLCRTVGIDTFAQSCRLALLASRFVAWSAVVHARRRQRRAAWRGALSPCQKLLYSKSAARFYKEQEAVAQERAVEYETSLARRAAAEDERRRRFAASLAGEGRSDRHRCGQPRDMDCTVLTPTGTRQHGESPAPLQPHEDNLAAPAPTQVLNFVRQNKAAAATTPPSAFAARRAAQKTLRRAGHALLYNDLTEAPPPQHPSPCAARASASPFRASLSPGRGGSPTGSPGLGDWVFGSHSTVITPAQERRRVDVASLSCRQRAALVKRLRGLGIAAPAALRAEEFVAEQETHAVPEAIADSPVVAVCTITDAASNASNRRRRIVRKAEKQTAAALAQATAEARNGLPLVSAARDPAVMRLFLEAAVEESLARRGAAVAQ